MPDKPSASLARAETRQASIAFSAFPGRETLRDMLRNLEDLEGVYLVEVRGEKVHLILSSDRSGRRWRDLKRLIENVLALHGFRLQPQLSHQAKGALLRLGTFKPGSK